MRAIYVVHIVIINLHSVQFRIFQRLNLETLDLSSSSSNIRMKRTWAAHAYIANTVYNLPTSILVTSIGASIVASMADIVRILAQYCGHRSNSTSCAYICDLHSNRAFEHRIFWEPFINATTNCRGKHVV